MICEIYKNTYNEWWVKYRNLGDYKWSFYGPLPSELSALVKKKELENG